VFDISTLTTVRVS